MGCRWRTTEASSCSGLTRRSFSWRGCGSSNPTRSEDGQSCSRKLAGYTLDEVKHVLDSEEYPTNMQAFNSELASLETVGGAAQRVFSRYDYDGAYADVLLTTIQSVHSATTLTRGDLIRFIERGIEDGSTHEVHASAGMNSVTVQTIHAAQGTRASHRRAREHELPSLPTVRREQ